MTRRDKYVRALRALADASQQLHAALEYERIHDVEATTAVLDGKLNNVQFLAQDAKDLVAGIRRERRG
jgi:hypothetical protein